MPSWPVDREGLLQHSPLGKDTDEPHIAHKNRKPDNTSTFIRFVAERLRNGLRHSPAPSTWKLPSEWQETCSVLAKESSYCLRLKEAGVGAFARSQASQCSIGSIAALVSSSARGRTRCSIWRTRWWKFLQKQCSTSSTQSRSITALKVRHLVVLLESHCSHIAWHSTGPRSIANYLYRHSSRYHDVMHFD